MSSSNGRFRHESIQDGKAIGSLVSALAKGLGKGRLTLGDDDGELVLETDGLMKLRIKAEREDGRNQVSLRISWSDPVEGASSKGTPRIES